MRSALPLLLIMIPAVIGAVLTQLLAVTSSASSITVTTDKACYDRGEVVALTVQGNGTVGVEVVGPSNNVVWLGQLSLNGSATVKFTIPSNAAEGNYSVYASEVGGVPSVVATFLVRNPTFKFVSYTKSVSGYENTLVTVTVTVKNYGADGQVEVIVVDDQGKVVTSKYAFIRYRQEATLKLSFYLPSVSASKTMTWQLALIDVKYGTTDDVARLSVSVNKAAVPVAPPAVTTTVPTTTTTAITTTTPPITTTVITTTPAVTTRPPTVAVIKLEKVIAPNGTVTKEVRSRLPVGGTLVIPKGTSVTLKGKPVKEIVVTPLTKPPPAPEVQKVVGPIYEIGPSGTVFSKPVTIVLPFDPMKIPVGYRPLAAYYNETLRQWVPLETVKVDYRTLTVTARITHLSIVSVVAFRVTYPVTTTPVVTVVKGVTSVVTVTKPVVTYLTVTSTHAVTATSTTTVTAVTSLTVPKTVASTTYVTLTTPVTVTAYTTTTEVVKVTKVSYVPQTSYTYASVIAVIVAVAVLITMSILGPRGGRK